MTDPHSNESKLFLAKLAPIDIVKCCILTAPKVEHDEKQTDLLVKWFAESCKRLKKVEMPLIQAETSSAVAALAK